MKIIFWGTPEYLSPILEVLDSNQSLVAIVTNPARPVGRNQILTPSPIAKIASEKYPQLPLLTPDGIDDLSSPEFVAHLQALEPDLCIVASYGQIIPEQLLSIPKHGYINIHPSLLPKYRGACPIQAAILNGDKVSGVSIIQMDQQMDHGPIILQNELPITPSDTFGSYILKAFELSGKMLKELLPELEKYQSEAQIQDESKATYTWKTSETKEKAYFEIDNPPTKEELDQMIRAFYPWPAAWTKWQQKIVKIYPEKQVQIEGKNKVSYQEFFRGYPDCPLKGILS